MLTIILLIIVAYVAGAVTGGYVYRKINKSVN